MNQKEYIGRKIRDLRENNLHISADKLGEMIEPKKSGKAVLSWERGRTQPDGDTLIQLCTIFGVDISDFYYKTSEYINAIKISSNENDFVDVPVLGVIAAGTPIDMMEIDDTHPCPTLIRNSHPNSGWLKVEGDSYNEKLPNGCYALVDFDLKEPKENTPFAVCVNGYNATIKDIKKLANGFELIPRSYDPTYLPIIYDYNKEDTEEITIIGQVVYASFPFDWEF